MNAKKLLSTALLLASAPFASAAEISVSVTNLTYGMYFTPVLVSAHNANVKFFEVGTPASEALKTMAETGNTSQLEALVSAQSGVNASNISKGPLAPSRSTDVAEINTGTNMYLSAASMLLPTNDAFFALNSWPIPAEPGTYTVMLNAYDAGTEANNEVSGGGDSGMPAPDFLPQAGSFGAAGANGTGVTTDEVNYVHIHRGALGDDDLTGGESDLDNTVHRWLNPVARIVITVK